MNTITKIALSLSLTALVAQHMHAAPYSDHAKKAAKIALHSGQLTMGVICAGLACGSERIKTYNNGRGFLSNSLGKDDVETGIYMISALTMLNIGCSGLKKEICPGFKSIEFAKKVARTAWHAGQVVGGVTFALSAHTGLRELIYTKKFEPIPLFLIPGIGLLSAAVLNSGVRGLKKEICPNFNPVEWIKNKLSKKSEQPV